MNLLNDIIKNPHSMLAVQAGHYDGITCVHVSGANLDISNSSVPESVWSGNGPYPWSAFNTAAQLSLVSTSLSDVGVVKIDGLDDNYYQISEMITLTGTSAVSTQKSFKRVNMITYIDGAQNVGKITASIGGTAIGIIDVGKGRSVMAVFTVPENYSAFLLVGDASVNKGHDAQIEFYGRAFGGAFIIQHMAEVYESAYRYDFVTPLILPEKTDLDVRVSAVENSGTRVTANFDLLLVRNDG